MIAVKIKNGFFTKLPFQDILKSSRLQPGDEDLSQIPFSDIAGRHIVVEEKCDGANSAVSFDRDGALLGPLPVVPVPVLAEGEFRDKEALLALLGPSNYITRGHIEHLREDARQLGLGEDRQCRETDASNLMEGLYLKVEENGEVADRLKFVRASFTQAVDASQSHWQDRPIVPNRLCRPTDDLFLPGLR